MGNICRSLCEATEALEEKDTRVEIDGYMMKKNERDYIMTILEDRDKFSQFIDVNKFAFYFGVSFKIDEGLLKNWKKVDIEVNRSQFVREKVNEAVFPKLKFLIRKGVPLLLTKTYLQSVFGISNLNTDIEYKVSYKLISDNIDSFLGNCPTFGLKVKIEKLLYHHCLTREGIKVVVRFM